MRMLMNNLHPDVAEIPWLRFMVVRQGARTWEDFDMITTLRS